MQLLKCFENKLQIENHSKIEISNFSELLSCHYCISFFIENGESIFYNLGIMGNIKGIKIENSFYERMKIKNFRSFILALLFLGSLFIISKYNYLVFHTLAEFISILVAWSLFLIVWNTRETARNDALMFLGIAYFFIGGVDLFHTLAYRGMGVFNSDRGANPATQLWIIARYMESLSLCFVPFLLGKRIKISLPIGVFSIFSILAFFTIFVWQVFPDCYVERSGLTSFKKISEYVICIILSFALFFLYKKRILLNEKVYKYLIISIVLTIICELIFTFYISVYSLSNLIGHFLKIVGFYFVYKAVIFTALKKPFDLLFKEISDKEKQYRQMFETNLAIKLVIDPSDSSIVDANNAACSFYGYTREELLSLHIFDINTLSMNEISEEMDRAFKEKKLYFNFIHRLASGEMRDVEVYSGPILLGQKELLYSIIHDVSERKKAEEDLQESEDQMRSMIEQAPYGISLIDSITGKMLEVNTRYAEILGLSKEEMTSLDWMEITHPEDIQEDLYNMNLLKNGLISLYSMEKRYLHSNGSVIWVELTMTLIKTRDNENPKYMAMVKDITEQKCAEEEKAKLQEQVYHNSKMDAIGQLAGGMAHDFNNMLSGIMSSAQLLKSPKRNLDDKGNKYVDMILQASERAAKTIAKLLTFGRKESLSLTVMDLHHVIDETVSITNNTFDKKIVIPVEKIAQNSLVIGDRSNLQNILLNLCINASHAMPDGGEIRIGTKNIYLDQKYCTASSFEIKPGDYLQIRIKDSGCGIPEDHIQKIFDPFYTTKEQDKGTGLGLSAVYGTIQDHHGSIEVNSKVGSGTTFYILLPCSQQLIKPVEEISPIITGAGTILLVDDEEMNRVLNKDILESLGYKVLLAEDGLESVEIYREKHSEIDIVLLDMIMPQMNGSEAFYKMKEIDENCKVIISSGYTRDENIEELIKNGLAGFINKPFKISDISQLLDKIHKVNL